MVIYNAWDTLDSLEMIGVIITSVITVGISVGPLLALFLVEDQYLPLCMWAGSILKIVACVCVCVCVCV